jgi:3-deoxy-7-phosphoheptulonate synthase
MSTVENTRVHRIRPLIPPACLSEELPLTPKLAEFVERSRTSIVNIMKGKDDRLMMVVGPCSIHDPKAAIDYATRLSKVAKKYVNELLIVMRVYFEKPRTTIGWKGLINDLELNGSFNINKGLRVARSLLLQINEVGLPVACEFLDTISPQFLSDLISWGAIGARTTESQLHRELVSGLLMPIGFKNASSGDTKTAIDAMVAAHSPHSFLGVTKEGLAAIVQTTGSSDTHIVLRGGHKGPNYNADFIGQLVKDIRARKLHPAILVDSSHDNSEKDYRKQPSVVENVLTQAKSNLSIIGLMVESNIEGGAQRLELGKKDNLKYGQSITDGCIDWNTTEALLALASQTIQERRQIQKPIKSAL